MGQQETVAAAGGALLRRMILVLAVAALIAAMMVVMAVPAVAKNVKDPGAPGPPALSGKGSLDGTVVAHCNPIDGTKSTTVLQFQNEKFAGGGECSLG